MYMLLSLLSHFMHYPLPLSLRSDFILCSDLIHNLLRFHILHFPNYNSNFHMMGLDHLHLRFMLSYYTHFLLRLSLLLLALYDLYSSLRYLHNSSYFLPYRLSLHYMFCYFMLLYMFTIMFGFTIRHLYFMLMLHLHLMSYMFLMLDYNSMFHMLALPYLFHSMLLPHLPLSSRYPSMLLYMYHFTSYYYLVCMLTSFLLLHMFILSLLPLLH